MAILNFMVFFPGKEKKPTFFKEKIWTAILTKGITCNAIELFDLAKHSLPEQMGLKDHSPKLHTIREDKTNRWKAGMMIDFFINARTKNMLRFAPRVKVVSVQKIEITYFDEQNPKFTAQLSKIAAEYYNEVEVVVDNEVLNAKAINELVKNDGFVTPEDFFAWFNKDFSGKIIHWTDLKY